MNDTPAIDFLAPLRWLALGWADLRLNPVPGLVHGLALTAAGGLGPLLVVGLFEL